MKQGTLLMAMAHGLPIVSTPTHHALELLHDSRGIIIPYEDTTDSITTLAEALNALLGCSTLRSTMVRSSSLTRRTLILLLSTQQVERSGAWKAWGQPWHPWAKAVLSQEPAECMAWIECVQHASVQGARAQELVKGWTWQSVALQYAALLSEEIALPAPLLEDPFLSIHVSEATASWHGTSLRLLSGHARNLTADMGLHGCTGGRLYALYVDVDIQVRQPL